MSFLAAAFPSLNGLSLNKGCKIKRTRWPAGQANINFVLERSNCSVPLFDQPEPLTHDLARRAIASGLDLFLRKFNPMVTERN